MRRMPSPPAYGPPAVMVASVATGQSRVKPARRDLLLAGTVMALAGTVTIALRPLSPDWRGIAASATLGAATLAEVGSIAWWIL